MPRTLHAKSSDSAAKGADVCGAGDSSRLPCATGFMTRLAYARAKAAGVAMEPLLREAGLSLSVVENPDVRLRVRDQIQFLNLVSVALADEFLGFHLAQIPDLRELGLLYYVMASAETLPEALQRGARYSAIVNEGVSQRYVAEGADVGILLRYVGVSRHSDRHQIEFWLTALIRVCRQLTGVHLLPRRVWLIHFREHHCTEFAEFFGDHIKFGAAADEVIFSGSIKGLPVVTADPYLNKILVAYCEEALSDRSRSPDSFRSSVENTAIPLLPHGKAHAAEIASRLGVGQRTFARRLASEGLTFSDLLRNLRLDLAKRYLADRDLSVSKIAWLLGFQEVSGFSHAFKHWSGKTPREARARR